MLICTILWVYKYESKTNFTIYFFQDAHESDSDKDDHVEDNSGQQVLETHQETKVEPKVSITIQTVGTQRETDLRHGCVIGTLKDGAGCCEPQDSEKQQLSKSCSDFLNSSVYPPELHKHLQDPSIPSSLLHSTQVNTWNSCATMDRAVSCGLNLAAPVRTPETPGFPLSLQQHPLVQVLKHIRTQIQKHKIKFTEFKLKLK